MSRAAQLRTDWTRSNWLAGLSATSAVTVVDSRHDEAIHKLHGRPSRDELPDGTNKPQLIERRADDAADMRCHIHAGVKVGAKISGTVDWSDVVVSQLE